MRVRLYLDDRADAAQREALQDLFLGSLGGTAVEHFPWAWKPSNLLGVHAVTIEIGHEVTCVIPGHDRSGEELIAGELLVDDGGLRFDFVGTSGYAASVFEYRSAR